jgi:predicted dinucleotide-binding enzyme
MPHSGNIGTNGTGAHMKIGIIGAGNIGATLARRLSAARHTVLLANSRGPDTIADLAGEAGATAVPVAEAVKDVDVIIMSIPLGKIPSLKKLLAEVPADVAVADTSNYYPQRDGRIPALDNGQTESIWVSEQIGRPVVKAWNSVLAGSLATEGKPAGAEGRIALPVAGDDSDAKKVIIGLVDATGFDGIDAGTLAESWRQQPGNPAYCTDLEADDLRRALSAADRSRAPQLRDLAIEKVQKMGPFESVTNEDLLNINRSLHV